jgi:hypothetical protein
VEQYLELRHQALRTAAAAQRNASSTLASDESARVAAVGAAGAATVGASAGAGSSAGAGTASAAEQREARKEMARIEKQLSRLAEREERIHAAMAEAATDHATVLVLNSQLREVVDEREVLELNWLAAAEVVG